MSNVDRPSRQSTDGSITRAIKQQRRLQWQWNGRLGIWTLLVLLVVGSVASFSYWYNSRKAGATFLLRAETAAKSGAYGEQAKWLRRYSLIEPNNLDAVADAAVAADNAADEATAAKRYAAVDNARKQLSSALSRLAANGDEKLIADLRGRLITRLLQLGGFWSREAERQVVALQAPREDPQATKWLAKSLIKQVLADTYMERDASEGDPQVQYWDWLANQRIADVITLAIDRNPQDIDLIANFLGLFESHPELFKQGDSLADQERYHQDRLQDLEQAIASIRSNQDSQSRLIVHQFDSSRGHFQEARQGLVEGAQQASQRLNSRSAAGNPTTPTGGSNNERPAYHWDYVLLLSAAKAVSQQDAPSEIDVDANLDTAQAAQWYDQLMALEPDTIPEVPSTIVEDVFVFAGGLQDRLGDSERAIEIWEQGLERVDSHSVDLLWPLAYAHSQGVSDSKAIEAVDDFGAAIEIASARLTRVSADEMSTAHRIAFGRQLDVAKWRHEVLQGYVDIRTGKGAAAIHKLSNALYSAGDFDIGDNEKVSVASTLAELCKAEGSWDQAAAAYDRAIHFAPADIDLRVAAAEAWTKSGNRLQAIEQWRIAGSAESLAVQVQSVNALFDYQLRLAPQQRDFSGLRPAIQRIRNSMPQPADAADDLQRQELEFAKRRLDLLEIFIPPRGVPAEEHLQSASLTEGIAELADKYTDDETIQALAAERLAAAGMEQRSTEVLQRFEEMVGPSAALAIVKARIEANRGDPLTASQRLVEHAENDKQRVVDVLQLASAFAVRGNNPELAYRALSNIPEDQRPLSILFLLGNLAKSLPEHSEILKENGKNLEPLDLSLRYEQLLREREGNSGSYWRFMKATRMIDSLRSESNGFNSADSRVREIHSLIRDILTARPRWGEAISLEGWMFALEGKPDKAAEHLRRGMSAGDSRVQTRLLLAEQLITLNRDAEAESVFNLAELSMEMPVDRYASTRINLAQRQGDYLRAVSLAEATVAQRPTDFVSHLLLAMAASKAAENAEDGPQRTALIEQARTAINNAGELTDKDESSLYAARLQLELTHGNPQSIRDEIPRIQASDLDRYSKLILESQTRVQLQEYQAALPLLKEANDLKPTPQTKLALIDLYRRLQLNEEEIAALRELHRSDPKNEAYRNDLARALATRDGRDVDWDEISDLLSTSEGVTPNNRFMHAVLLGTKGSPSQRSQAAEMLRGLIEEQNSGSDDARRFLAVLLRMQYDADVDLPSPLDDPAMLEIETLYETLVQRAPPAVVDLYRYADFLLDINSQENLPKIEHLLTNLQSVPAGAIPALEIGIRYSDRTGTEATIGDFVRSWVKKAIEDKSLTEPNAASIAGASLFQLGFFDASVPYFEQAYSGQPQAFRNYVIALNKVGQHDRSIQVCTEHFETHQDVVSATLLVESLLGATQDTISPQHRMLILQALESFNDHAPLLEGVATLRLQQGSYQEAIPLYERVQKLAPTRLRTLNNLAMAYSELPNRAADGIAAINRAIELAGPRPELLDTKGVVLLKAGKLDEALEAFQAAISKAKKPDYQFHLVVTLLAMQQDDDAKLQWQSLDRDALNLAALTPSEREQLTILADKFDSNTSDPNIQQEIAP